MTSPVPVGNGRVPAQPRPATAGYTHRHWMTEMADVLGHVAGIYQDLQVMDATLHEVQAGRTQLALVGDCSAAGLELMRRGVRFVEETDARYLPVFEAIRSAGGQEEVARDKRYHDRD